MLIDFKRKLDLDKDHFENNYSECCHYVDLFNGKIALYGKEFALIGNINLKDFGINPKKQKYRIDTTHKMIGSSNNTSQNSEANSVILHDFLGRELFESSRVLPRLSDQEILDFSVFKGRYLWMITNTSCMKVTCTLHDLQTQQTFSLPITDPLAVKGALPKGEHVVTIMVLSENRILLNFTDAQTCMANFLIEKNESSLCLGRSIEDDHFPLCFLDNILLARSYDVWDGYFRLYSLPDFTILKDIPYENEDEDDVWDCWQAFSLKNGKIILEDSHIERYLCLDFNKVCVEKLEIRFDEEHQTEKFELQYNNHVLFAINHANKTPVLFCYPDM